MDGKELLNERDNTTYKETKIRLDLSYSWLLPNSSKVFRKYWNILSINKSFKEIFKINR